MMLTAVQQTHHWSEEIAVQSQLVMVSNCSVSSHANEMNVRREGLLTLSF